MQISAKRLTCLSSRHCSRNELFGVFNVALQSSNQCCWSSSAAVCSDSFSPKLGKGKVAREERREKVLAFVEQYRALNGGKFPSASFTQKQVGGSYYVVREIVQKLEHNHKRKSLEINKEFKLNEETAMFEPISLTEETDKQASFKEFVGNSTEFQSLNSIIDNKEGSKISRLSSEIHSVNMFENREGRGVDLDNLHESSCSSSQAHTYSDMADSETMNHVQVKNIVSSKLGNKDTISRTLSEKREVYLENESSVASKHDNVIRSKESYHGDQRQMFKVGGALPTKISNIWDSLKSMAVGIIINLWKK